MPYFKAEQFEFTQFKKEHATTMLTAQQLQDNYKKLSDRKHGHNFGPQVRVGLIEAQVDRLKANPCDIGASAKLLIHVLDLARKQGCSGDELITAANQQVEIWKTKQAQEEMIQK